MVLINGPQAVATPARPRFGAQRLLTPRAVLMVLLGVLVLSPVVALQWRAMSNGGVGYVDLLNEPNLLSVFWMTLVLAVGSVLIALTLGIALARAAYALRGRASALSVLPMLGIAVPPTAAITGWAFLLSPSAGYINQALRLLPWWSESSSGPVDIYSILWIVVLTGLTLTPYVYIFVLSGMRSIDRNLLAAARTCGSSGPQTFFAIMLPLLRPQILYSAGIVLLLGLGQFTAPLLLGRQAQVEVLSTEMFRAAKLFPVNYELAAAYGSPLIIFGAILIVFQKRLIGDVHRYATVQGTVEEEKKSSVGAAAAIWSFMVLSVFLPLLGLLFVAFSPFWTRNFDLSKLTASNFEAVLGNPLLFNSITTGLTLSVVATAITIPLAYGVAIILATRSSGPVRQALDIFTNLPLALPGVVFGAGILFGFTFLYGSASILVLAYVVIVVPHLVRIILGRLVSTGWSYAEAARVAGANPLRTHLTVILPLTRGAIASGAGLAVALLSHEFAASLMLRSTKTPVMGTALYDLWTSGTYPHVAVLGLLMCLVTSVAVVFAVLIGGRKAVESF